MGRLVKDPDLRFATDGKAVVKITVATNRPMKRDEADFINCTAFGKLAETIAEYLTKGRQIAINGNIRTGSYDAKDGTKRYTTEVLIETFEFIQGYKSSNNKNTTQANTDSFNNIPNTFDDMTPMQDDGDIPF